MGGNYNWPQSDQREYQGEHMRISKANISNYRGRGQGKGGATFCECGTLQCYTQS